VHPCDSGTFPRSLVHGLGNSFPWEMGRSLCGHRVTCAESAPSGDFMGNSAEIRGARVPRFRIPRFFLFLRRYQFFGFGFLRYHPLLSVGSVPQISPPQSRMRFSGDKENSTGIFKHLRRGFADQFSSSTIAHNVSRFCD
jgi:hypothetical protein